MSSTAAQPPIIIGSRNAVFTGVYGAAFSDVRVRMPAASSLPAADVLAQTQIAMDCNGVPYLYDYGTGIFTAVGPAQYYGNSSQPSISGQGTRIAYAQEDTSGQWQLYTSALDGSGKIAVAPVGSTATSPAFSPDGTKVAFVKYDSVAGRYRIYWVGGGGGAVTAITPATDNAFAPTWSPDGTKLAFFDQTNGSGNYNPALINLNGTSLATMPGGLGTPYGPGSLAFIPGTNMLMEAYQYSASGYQLWRISLTDGGFNQGTSSDFIGSVSSAPVGNMCVLQRGGASGGIFVRDIVKGTETQIADSTYNSPEWGPYMSTRYLVGASGAMGTAAGGFIFGQMSTGVVRGFVAVDATTRSTITITKQTDSSAYQGLAVCIVTADSLTSLKYINDLGGGVTAVVIPAGAVNGAIIAFNADTGRVVSVIPYTGAAPAIKGTTYTGKFLGVYDALGKNLAQSGATSVSLNESTGAPLAVH